MAKCNNCGSNALSLVRILFKFEFVNLELEWIYELKEIKEERNYVKGRRRREFRRIKKIDKICLEFEAGE